MQRFQKLFHQFRFLCIWSLIIMLGLYHHRKFMGKNLTLTRGILWIEDVHFLELQVIDFTNFFVKKVSMIIALYAKSSWHIRFKEEKSVDQIWANKVQIYLNDFSSNFESAFPFKYFCNIVRNISNNKEHYQKS